MGSPATPGAAAELMRARAALQAALGHRRAAARLEEKVDSLEAVLADSYRRVTELRHELRVEEADVEHWTGHGFGPFVYWLFRELDDRREREMGEAEEASVRLADEADRGERVRAELAAARHELRSARELATVDQARDLVRTLLHEFLPDEARDLDRLEEQHAATVVDLRETEEALAVCEQSIDLAQAALDRLLLATEWGTWSMRGNGLIASSIRHQKVEEGLVHVQRLNVAMARLRRECSQVQMRLHVPHGMEHGSTTRVLDAWFDNIFDDWNIHDRVATMQESVAMIGSRLIDVHHQLTAHRTELLHTLGQQRAIIDRLYAVNG
jgi:hypothetical protein